MSPLLLLPVLQCERSIRQNCHIGQNDDKFAASCDTSSDETAATQCCAYKTPDSQSETSIFCYGKLFKAQFLQITPSLNKTNNKKNLTIMPYLVYNTYIFFWFTVSTFSLPLYICAVSHSHAIFASNLPHSLWPWCLTIPTMQCPTKAHCPGRAS